MNGPDHVKNLRLGRWSLTVTTGCPDSVLQQVNTYIAAGPQEAWVPLQSSGNASVWKFPSGGTWYVLKEYLGGGRLQAVKSVFRGTRAERAWNNCNQLIRSGFPSPAPVLWAAERSGSLASRNFLVAEYVLQSCGIHSFVLENFPFPVPKDRLREKRSLITQFGSFIGDLHARGFFHGDLRLENILVTVSGKGGYCFFLIDNERNRHFPGGIPYRYRLRNLVQANIIIIPEITMTDRMRFFNAYLENNPGMKTTARAWVRRVFILTRKRLWKKFPGLWNNYS